VGTALGQFWAFALVALALLLLVFPDGGPPSPRWRPVLWLGIGAALSSYVLFLLKPMPVEPITGLTSRTRSPSRAGTASSGPRSWRPCD
jgi:hypothetical protein